MGDDRFVEPLARLKQASDRTAAVKKLTYEELVLALGAASREQDAYLANVLTTALLNRTRRGAALVFSAGLGVSGALVLMLLLTALLAGHPHNFDDHLFLVIAAVALLAGAAAAYVLHPPILDRLMDRRA